MHQSGLHSMTEQNNSNLSWVTDMIHFFIEWTLERGLKSACHGGVLGSHKRHQKWPKCTKVVTIAWQSKVFRICPKWQIWSIFGLSGDLKEDMSQRKSWRGYGVAHEVHQNTSKCTRIHQNGHHSKREQSVSNLPWVINMIHFWIKWTLKRG